MKEILKKTFSCECCDKEFESKELCLEHEKHKEEENKKTIRIQKKEWSKKNPPFKVGDWVFFNEKENDFERYMGSGIAPISSFSICGNSPESFFYEYKLDVYEDVIFYESNDCETREVTRTHSQLKFFASEEYMDAKENEIRTLALKCFKGEIFDIEVDHLNQTLDIKINFSGEKK